MNAAPAPVLAGVGWEHLDTCLSVILPPVNYIYTSTAPLASLVTGPLGRVSTHEVRGKYLIATKIFDCLKNICLLLLQRNGRGLAAGGGQPPPAVPLPGRGRVSLCYHAVEIQRCMDNR